MTQLPALLAQGPSGPGVPPFATLDGSTYDRINLASGGLTFTFPIRSKSGPYPFSVQASGSSGPYIRSDVNPTTGSSTRSWSVSSFGLGLNTEVTAPSQAGKLTYTAVQQTCGTLGVNQETYTSYSQISIVDSTGAIHPTNASPGYYINPCTNTTYPATSGQVYNTTDGSGYTLIALAPGQPSFNIYDRSGNKLVCGNQCGQSSPATLGTATSPNGLALLTNTFVSGSSPTNTFQDAFGTTFLTVSNNQTFTYLDSSGGSQKVALQSADRTFQTNYGCSGLPDAPAEPALLPTSLTAPNWRSFTFSYEPTPGFPSSTTSRISSIGLPSGGSISYTYSGNFCNSVQPTTITRSIYDGRGNTAKWTYNFGAPTLEPSGGYSSSTTVTDPNNNDTVLSFYNGFQTQATTYQGSAGGGTILKTVLTCYNGVFTNCASGSSQTQTSLALFVSQKDVYTSIQQWIFISHRDEIQRLRLADR